MIWVLFFLTFVRRLKMLMQTKYRAGQTRIGFHYYKSGKRESACFGMIISRFFREILRWNVVSVHVRGFVFFFLEPWLKQAVRNLQQIFDLHIRRSSPFRLHKHVMFQDIRVILGRVVSTVWLRLSLGVNVWLPASIYAVSAHRLQTHIHMNVNFQIQPARCKHPKQ